MSNLSSFLGGSTSKVSYFTSSGTFTKPSNVSWVQALLVGGGGGAYSTNSGTYFGGGGGGQVILRPVYLTGNSTITIGSGGTGTNFSGSPTVAGNTTMTNAEIATLTASGGNSGFKDTGGGAYPMGGNGGGAGASWMIYGSTNWVVSGGGGLTESAPWVYPPVTPPGSPGYPYGGVSGNSGGTSWGGGGGGYVNSSGSTTGGSCLFTGVFPTTIAGGSFGTDPTVANSGAGANSGNSTIGNTGAAGLAIIYYMG